MLMFVVHIRASLLYFVQILFFSRIKRCLIYRFRSIFDLRDSRIPNVANFLRWFSASLSFTLARFAQTRPLYSLQVRDSHLLRSFKFYPLRFLITFLISQDATLLFLWLILVSREDIFGLRITKIFISTIFFLSILEKLESKFFKLRVLNIQQFSISFLLKILFKISTYLKRDKKIHVRVWKGLSLSNVHHFDDLSPFIVFNRLSSWTNGLIRGAADFPAERKRPSARWTRQIFCNQLVTSGRARRFHQGRGFLPPPDNVEPDPKHGTLQILPVFKPQPRWFLHETRAFLFSPLLFLFPLVPVFVNCRRIFIWKLENLKEDWRFFFIMN